MSKIFDQLYNSKRPQSLDINDPQKYLRSKDGIVLYCHGVTGDKLMLIPSAVDEIPIVPEKLLKFSVFE